MAVNRYELGGLVFSVTYDFARLERNICKVAGLYQGQPRILTILQEHEGITLSELSPICNIGMPSLSVSIRNMQKSGFLYKEGSGKGQRIYLTDKGRTSARIFHEEIDGFYAGLLEQLGEDGSQALHDAFAQFDQYIQTYNQKFEQSHSRDRD